MQVRVWPLATQRAMHPKMRHGHHRKVLWPLLVFLGASLVGAATADRRCNRDEDCGHREQCLDTRKSPGHFTCHCYRFVMSDETLPTCVHFSVQTVGLAFIHILMVLACAGALYHHCIAFLDHMRDPPMRQNETLVQRLFCLRVFFLVSSIVYVLSGIIFVTCADLMMWLPAMNTKWWEDAPRSPFVLSLSIHFLAADYFLFTFACVWIRVAAEIHDRTKPARGLWCLVLSLDGTGLGLCVALLLAVPLGAGVMYATVMDLNSLGTGIGCLCLLLAAACFYLGSWLLADARTGRGLFHCWCHAWWSSHVHPTPPSSDGQGDRGNHGGGGGNNVQGHGEAVGGAGSNTNTRNRRGGGNDDEDLIQSVSAMTLLSTNDTAGRDDGGVKADIERGQQTRKTWSAETTSASSQQIQQVSQVLPDPGKKDSLSLKMRVVQRDARTLSFRVATLLIVALSLLSINRFVPLLRWSYFMQACNSCLGFLLVLVANLNLLYYLSPLPRRTIQIWIQSDSTVLPWLAGLLAPWNSYGASDEDDEYE